VRKICEEVITSELTGKTWNGEEEPVWTVRISEQIKARARGEYGGVSWVARRALSQGLLQLWAVSRVPLCSHSRVLPFCVCAALAFPRYKLVVQVVLGQSKDQGVKIASRCLWDTETDNHASFFFKNVSSGRACKEKWGKMGREEKATVVDSVLPPHRVCMT
jgi:hypothetical protein